MKQRYKILTAITLLCLCFIGYGVANHYSPYAFPEEKCFTKNGDYFGSVIECNGNSAQIFEQATTSIQYKNAVLPIGNKAREICLKMCRNANICSHFSVHPPAQYYDKRSLGEPNYQCSFYKYPLED